MKLKGRYVALVEVDFDADTDEPHTTSFREMNDRLHNGWMEKTMMYQVENIFRAGNPNITITPQFADLYEMEGEQP